MVQDAIRVWKAGDLDYVPVGVDRKMTFCNPIDPAIGPYHAGFLDANGGTLVWTEKGDEFIWVISGTITITYGEEVYTLEPGDFIFMRDGIDLTMTGTDDARIAYISHLPPQGA
ncbi:MAG: cupin domain-containing protein [Thermomicrobiales bacterium]